MSSFSALVTGRTGNIIALSNQTNLKVSSFSNREGDDNRAQIVASGNDREVWDLLRWLKYNVEIKSGKGDTVWKGYVSSVTIDYGPFRLGKSLDLMANAVRVLYSNGLSSRLTEWLIDNDSISQYGRKEERLSSANLISGEATEAAQAYLDSYSLPVETVDYRSRKGSQIQAVIDCRGYSDFLAWRLYQNGDGRIDSAGRPGGRLFLSGGAVTVSPVTFGESQGRSYAEASNGNPFEMFASGDTVIVQTATLAATETNVFSAYGSRIVFDGSFDMGAGDSITISPAHTAAGQSFKYTGSRPMFTGNLTCDLKKYGSPSGAIKARLWSGPFVSGAPATLMAESTNQIAPSAISSDSFSSHTFYFNNVSVSPNTEYWFTLKNDVSESGKYVYVATSTGDVYSNGSAKRYNTSGGWYDLTDKDLPFSVEGRWTLKDFIIDIYNTCNSFFIGLDYNYPDNEYIYPLREGDYNGLQELRSIERVKGSLRVRASKERFLVVEATPTIDTLGFYALADGTFQDSYGNKVEPYELKSGQWYCLKDSIVTDTPLSRAKMIYVEEVSYIADTGQVMIVPRQMHKNL